MFNLIVKKKRYKLFFAFLDAPTWHGVYKRQPHLLLLCVYSKKTAQPEISPEPPKAKIQTWSQTLESKEQPYERNGTVCAKR